MSSNLFIAHFAIGASLSASINIGASLPVAVLFTTAAFPASQLSFQASADGTSFGNVYDLDGTEYQVPAGAGRWVGFSAAPFRGASFIRVRLGLNGAPVVPTSPADLTVITQPAVAIGRYE